MNKMSTKLCLVTGSIFEPSKFDLDALIIWLPCGLTAIRCDWLDFARRLEGRIYHPDGNRSEAINIPHAIRTKDTANKAKQFALYGVNPPIDGLRYLHLDLNLGHRVEDPHDIPFMVNESMEAITSLGARSIGMNGIRTRCHARQSELTLMHSISDWITQHNEKIDKVCLIDKRGGFEKHLNRIDNYV